jgi:hypothetical protein
VHYTPKQTFAFLAAAARLDRSQRTQQLLDLRAAGLSTKDFKAVLAQITGDA